MLKIGDYVQVKNTIVQGNIIRIQPHKQLYTIQSDRHTVQVDFDQVEKIEKPTHKKEVSVTYDMLTPQEIPTEIMLRHQTVEEALYHLDLFMDHALLHHVKQVKIIHGRSGGILRKAVHEYLQKNAHVQSYRLGNYFEGSYGVTIAILK